jgi:hypothetical protein
MMFGKVTFVAVLMILSAMVFASLRGPRVADFEANGSDNSHNILRSSQPGRIPGIGKAGTGVASFANSSLSGAGGFTPPAAPAPDARPAPVSVAPPQVAKPADSSDQQVNDDHNSNDNDSNDNDSNNSSDDRNSNDDNDNSGDQAMNNQGPDEQANNPFTQEVPPNMWRTPNGQLLPRITPPAIAPFPPRLTNN